ncbi:MAG: hypothetical protein EAZ95_18115, partial [Bacteroidetes bacterium]
METQSTQPQPAWYVLCVKPNTELKVRELLRKAGFETCLPTQSVQSQRKDRQTWKQKPVFTGYVFASCLPKDRRNIFVSPYVMQLLREAGKPVRLREADITLIKGMEASQAKVHFTQKPLTTGEAVRIITGDFAGIEGTVTALQNSQINKVYVALACLQYELCLEIAETDLE